MQISSIQSIGSGRSLVTVEDGQILPLYQKEIFEYSIREGEELSDQNYRIIIEEVLPKRAKMRAMHLLQKMDHTEFQLRQKLESCFYPENSIEEAVAYVKQYHYIDDIRYAETYMRYRADKKSRRELEQELYKKGIDRELIAAVAEQIEFPDEKEQIRYWLEKRHFVLEEDNQKETQKIVRFLQRKGFRLSSILDIIYKTV